MLNCLAAGGGFVNWLAKKGKKNPVYTIKDRDMALKIEPKTYSARAMIRTRHYIYTENTHFYYLWFGKHKEGCTPAIRVYFRMCTVCVYNSIHACVAYMTFFIQERVIVVCRV